MHDFGSGGQNRMIFSVTILDSPVTLIIQISVGEVGLEILGLIHIVDMVQIWAHSNSFRNVQNLISLLTSCSLIVSITLSEVLIELNAGITVKFFQCEPLHLIFIFVHSIFNQSFLSGHIEVGRLFKFNLKLDYCSFGNIIRL